jgi:steroid delta-isomerase-like uncharacterized protein
MAQVANWSLQDHKGMMPQLGIMPEAVAVGPVGSTNRLGRKGEAQVSVEANKATVRRIFEEVFNQRNLALADELSAPDAVNDAVPSGITPNGPESLKQTVQMLTSAFPDLHTTVDDMIAEGDKVVARTTLNGTHQGPLWGIAPTGKRVSQQQIHIMCLQDGKVAEHRAMRDDLGLMQQLGAIPGSGR